MVTKPFSQQLDLDHVELYVTDLDAAAHRYTQSYGFAVTAAAGSPEQGFRSLALRQGGIVLVLTEALRDEHPARRFVDAHGDGVAGIALRVTDSAAALAEALRRGARPAPRTDPGSGDPVAVVGFGDVVHTFVDAGPATSHAPLPGFTRRTPHAADGVGLLDVDHLAVCVPAGELATTIAFYQDVFGFQTTFTERIAVGGQAMNSMVVQSTSRTVTLTVLEPDPAGGHGQIDGFLHDHGGAGVQHVAFRAADAVQSVRTLGERGVDFLATPVTYYDALAARINPRRHSVAALRELHLLIDQDHNGQLFQIFARSTHPRRTLFFEVIERLGARTFGTANIRALYEAVEAERLSSPGVQR